ncbi:(d)CMP kinase [Halopelagius longus]|uniref:Cytidylate kinase n=1 Tax=Halopelagius longus TaxID=1236180 RepID=A0A1H0YLW7_9EURY|nr:AAA family ATPase [Halopelagius longus]RDI72563.1 cytidylate kinase [Halopelagius longus]SDQ16185.1 cytidylate kinase [Halopelagius longus]
MLLTVSGPAGSGKSTTAAGLAEALDLEHISGGDIFRELAAERGYSAVEFNKLAEEDDQIDRDLDRRLYTIATERDDVVLESRLAGWLAGEHADLRFWLDAPIAVRAARIADREDKSVELAREETEARERSEALRYEEYYNIPIRDLSIYDMVLNTARWGPDEVLDIMGGAVESYRSEADEGQYAVDGVNYDF